MTTGASLTGPITASNLRRGRRRGSLPHAGLLHAGLIAVVLLVCLALPRAGQGVLLVPLATSSRVQLLQSPGLERMAVLGRGRVPGSLVVRPAGSVPLWTLLRAGIVPLAVPLSLCGPAALPSSASPAPPISPRGSHG